MQPTDIDGFGPVSLVLIVLYFIGRQLYPIMRAKWTSHWQNRKTRRAAIQKQAQLDYEARERLLALCEGDPRLMEMCGLRGGRR